MSESPSRRASIGQEELQKEQERALGQNSNLPANTASQQYSFHTAQPPKANSSEVRLQRGQTVQDHSSPRVHQDFPSLPTHFHGSDLTNLLDLGGPHNSEHVTGVSRKFEFKMSQDNKDAYSEQQRAAQGSGDSRLGVSTFTGAPIEPIAPASPSNSHGKIAFWEQANAGQNPFVCLERGDLDSSLHERYDLSEKLINLSLVEEKTFSKKDFIAQWQNEADVSKSLGEVPSIGTTHYSCMDCFRVMLPDYYRALHDEPTLQDTLYRSCILLYEWGVAYSVDDGQFDQLPPEAKDMTDAVLSFLAEISTILIQRLPNLMDRTLVVGKSARYERPVVKPVPLMQPVAVLDDYPSYSESGEDLEIEHDTWEQCLAELHDYIVLLHELHPSIESWVALHETNPGPTAQDGFDHPGSQLYASMVKARFQKAPEDLVDTLGALNYDRFTRLADDRKHNQEESLQVQEISKGSSFHDSGIGSSLQQSEIGNSRCQNPSRASSVAFTLAGQSRTRFPQLPKDARYNSFACDFCGLTVSFRAKKEYEKHLLKDLQPYSCLELDCPSSKESFATRKDWIEHLQTSHGLKTDSPAQLCKLCGEATDGGMIAICRHLAEHLEAIALAASPMNIGSDGDSDADSTKSHGHERNEENKLNTIAEEFEDNAKPADKNDPRSARPAMQGLDLDLVPNCAICNSVPVQESKCPCESERLQIAVELAEQRALDDRLSDIRVWVINHARQHILKTFESLTSIRKQAHVSYLRSLPNYDMYMRYSGRPPISEVFVSTLQSQIAEGHAELKRGIDADWRASILRYPEVLDYFYGLIELKLPSDGSDAVVNPPFTQSGYVWEPGSDTKNVLTSAAKKGKGKAKP